MSRLALYFLGAPRIERDGEPVEVDTRKATALVAYLALNPGPQTRDTLAALLWPEYDDQHARGALRRTLSVLKGALGSEWLDVQQDTIALRRPADGWIDVDEFSAAIAAARAAAMAAAAAGRAAAGRAAAGRAAAGRAAAGRAAATAQHDPLPSDQVRGLAHAADLYRGDFLAGFTLRDSPDFDDWQFQQGETLRRDLAYALERLVAAYAGMDDMETAIRYGRRWLALDSLHEPAHRQLMRLYSAAGQRSAALRQYQECVRVLQEELGVPPLEETTRLYQEIKERRETERSEIGGLEVRAQSSNLEPKAPYGQSPISHVQSPISNLPSPSALPFVGRGAECERLLAAYAEAGRGVRLIVLEGEAGIGKSRLAEEFLRDAAGRGAAVAEVRCYQGETQLAYAPFVGLLRGLAPAAPRGPAPAWLDCLPAEHVAEAARLLPEIKSYRAVPPAPPLDGPGAQARFFDGLAQVLDAGCDPAPAQAPAVLFFDDAQWMDTASCDMLAYMARRPGARPSCLLVAWRSGEVGPGHPLRRLLAEGLRAGFAVHLPLGRLSPAAVSELVEKLPARSGARAAQLSSRLYEETEGLPFVLSEYLAALAHADPQGESKTWALPGGVRDLMAARLASAGEAGRQLLSTAAVIGRSFDFDTLRDASGRAEEETVAGLEELLSHGLIREVAQASAQPAPAAPQGTSAPTGSPAYDFTHEKLRAVVYEETSLARRRLLHRRVAETLLARSRGQNPGAAASTIAQHYHLAGQDAEAAEYYRLAGEHARSLYANVEALAHFQTALALGHPDVAGLHEAIGDVQTLLGDYGAGLASYDTAAALAPGAAPGLEHKLGMLRLRRGEWQLAAGHFGDALAALGEQGPASTRAHMYADWSLAAHRLGQAGRALELANRAYALAGEAGDRHALAQAENTLGILAKSRGDLEEARRRLEASLALAEELGDPAGRVAALNNLALACAALGDRPRARALTEQALALCAVQGDRHREAALHNNLADLLHAEGEREAAMAHLKQAVTLFADIRTEEAEPQPEIWKLVEW